MKLQGFSADITVPKPGTIVRKDQVNKSAVQAPTGVWVGDKDRFSFPEWKRGDMFALRVPCGVLVGWVRYSWNTLPAPANLSNPLHAMEEPGDGRVTLVVEDCEFQGAEKVLSTGKFGFGWFTAHLGGTVTASSFLPPGLSVNWAVYAWVKTARVLFGLDDEQSRDLLKRAQARYVKASVYDDARWRARREQQEGMRRAVAEERRQATPCRRCAAEPAEGGQDLCFACAYHLRTRSAAPKPPAEPEEVVPEAGPKPAPEEFWAIHELETPAEAAHWELLEGYLEGGGIEETLG